MMNLSKRILKFLHPQDEAQRMNFRMAVARATAEAEDVTRTINTDATAMRVWLARRREFSALSERCEFKNKNGAALVICKNPEHDAAGLGIAQCAYDKCPLLRSRRVPGKLNGK